ncbi:MAG: hypothetical protein J5I93_09650 [Pirellulaceae bacterium]|nr:hypothetical protein [Pirellulaceae bacterium]
MADKRDLVLLVPGANEEFVMRGILSRHRALNIRPLSWQCLRGQGDGGVRKYGASLLALRRDEFMHALMVLDHEGSGAERREAESLEADLDRQLQEYWQDRAKSIVIAPEVDVWMWGSDNALREVISWSKRVRIRTWAQEAGFKLNQDHKPERPKEALEAVLRTCGLPRSSATYEQIAKKVSLSRCTDPAFEKLRRQLQIWFAAN